MKKHSFLIAAALAVCLSAASYAQASPRPADSGYGGHAAVAAVFSADHVAPVAVAELVSHDVAAVKPHVALQRADQYEQTRGRQRPTVTPAWRLVSGA